MTAKTLGHRSARVKAVHNLVDLTGNNTLLAVLTYLALPAYAILLHRKTYHVAVLDEWVFTNLLLQAQFTVTDRRIFLIGLAFVLGLFGEHLWIHWIHAITTTPSYHFPAMVGLSLQVT